MKDGGLTKTSTINGGGGRGGNLDLVVVAEHGLDDGDGAVYHHHHHYHSQQDHQQQLLLQDPLKEGNDSPGTSKYHRAQSDYSQQRLLREHHRQHGYKCPLCCTTLQDIAAMRAHLDIHYPRDSPTCPVVSCGKTFSHPNSVRNHMRLKHPIEWDQIKTLRWTYV